MTAKTTSWISRNYKWILPVGFILLLLAFFLSMTGDATLRVGSVVANPSLVNNAIQQANGNNAVTAEYGNLSPTNSLAIIEGEVIYSNDNKTVDISLWVQGSKRRGKLDLTADYKNDTWHYRMIRMRDKKTRELLMVLE
ncbi:cytochrome c oxidase assembly factor Coa1 family protein [Aquimarina sp. W85]|uniref:cytochrome c oxidase assembly factor Coa1 family protein n=1 Tax=Aquimarina rhodophyticola TaxID=3342246 RepID=UPI003670CCC6